MSSPLIIDYYTDVLCIWAWISQRRITELKEQWGDKIEIHYHHLNLFGDTYSRMEEQWGERGGFDGFAKHTIEAAAPYENAPVNKNVWKKVRPLTSANAHVVLKAVALTYSSEMSEKLFQLMQKSFFVDSLDIGQLEVVISLAEKAGLDREKIKSSIDTGKATAALMQDYKKAKDLNVQGSPSWLMNNGRQTLFGNVGYRILNANIKEILEHPAQEASWC
jgi:predicted DsbA family dithiol-disulfide isomerase